MNRFQAYISDKHMEALYKLKKNKKIKSISKAIRDALDIYLKRFITDIDNNQQKITEGKWNDINN